MSRLIDADALKEVWTIASPEPISADAAEVLASIDNAPTVDAVPVVRGKLKPVKYTAHCSCGRSYETYHYSCSACNHISYAQPYGLNYCPNCGAKMDKE